MKSAAMGQESEEWDERLDAARRDFFEARQRLVDLWDDERQPVASLCPFCGKGGVGEKTGRCLVCGYDAPSAAQGRLPGVYTYPKWLRWWGWLRFHLAVWLTPWEKS